MKFDRLFFTSILFVLVLLTVISNSGCKKTDENQSGDNKTTTTITEAADFTTTTSAYISDTTAATAPTGIPAFGWCSVESLRVRSGPGTEYSGIGGLREGEKVTIVGREGDWFKIEFKDGFAYVSALHISATEVVTGQTATGSQTAGTATQPRQD